MHRGFNSMKAKWEKLMPQHDTIDSGSKYARDLYINGDAPKDIWVHPEVYCLFLIANPAGVKPENEREIAGIAAVIHDFEKKFRKI